MDLIEKLGKIDGRYKGTFKCPVCNNIVTRTVYDGIHNSTCGNQQCKSIFFPTTKITDLKYYRAFSEKYSQIKKKYVLCDEWSTINKFIESMYTKYVEAREHGQKITFVTTGNTPTPENSYWKPIKGTAQPRQRGNRIYTADYSNDISKGIYHVKMLADKYHKEHSRVMKKVRSLQLNTDFGATLEEYIEVDNGMKKFKSKTELLTKDQFNILDCVLAVSANSIKPTSVYVMQSGELTKIGIAQDVEKRRRSLYYSSALDVKILYSKEFKNFTSLEKELHKKYKDYNSHGEWFNLSDDQVKEIIEYLDNKE